MLSTVFLFSTSILCKISISQSWLLFSSKTKGLFQGDKAMATRDLRDPTTKQQNGKRLAEFSALPKPSACLPF
ncbi:hypothetical protein ACFX13_032195 [Malus domestica]